MALSTTLSLQLRAKLTKTDALTTTVTDTSPEKLTLALTSGVGDGQADRSWSQIRTIAGNGYDAIPFDGSFNDNLGDPFILARIKAVYVRNLSAVEGDILQVGGNDEYLDGGGYTLDGAVWTVGPKGVLVSMNPDDGWIVYPGVGDVLYIYNLSDNPITYRIIVVGASA